MCIITTEKRERDRLHGLKVTKTNIFARHTRPGYQALAYSLSIASRSAAAMILPLPVVPGSGEAAFTFIDLSGYERFFEDMSRACEPEFVDMFEMLDSDTRSMGSAAAAVVSLLEVHEVGDFEASYVPTRADFTRLDPRFRLSDDIWKKMPDYSDYGFAVFQLKLSLSTGNADTENEVHPMAFEFPTRDPDRLFFPTVHVHDGDFHEEAGFHHRLYCQRESARAEFKYQRDLLEGRQPTRAEELTEPPEPEAAEFMLHPIFLGYDWYFRSVEPTPKLMDIDRCKGLLDPSKKMHSMFLWGDLPNRDIWLGDSL